MLIKRYWRRVAGWPLAAFAVLWAGVGTIGNVDTLLAHTSGPRTTWLGKLVHAALSIPPQATPLIAIAGLLLIFWDYRVRHPKPAAIAPFAESDAELKRQASKWLSHTLGVAGAQQVSLFGSITHVHYPTSDVDVIVTLKEMGEAEIARTVRLMKGTVAGDFERTFGHKLHLQFFCAQETKAQEEFERQQANLERLLLNSVAPSELPSLRE